MKTRGLAIVVLALLFGAVVIFNVVYARSSTQRVSEALVRAQGERFRDDLRRRLSASRDHAATLESFLEAHRADGLRYVSVQGPMRGFSAGDARGEAHASSTNDRLFDLGDRRRFELRTQGRVALHVAFEFEPQLLEGVHSETRRALGLAVLTALLAALLAWAYRREVLGRAELEGRIERERHLTLLGEMSTVLAHELRNPLTSLRGQAMLLEEKLEDSDRALATQIIDDAKRIDQLSTDLLDFGGSMKLDLREVDPIDLVERAVGAVELDGIVVDAEGAPSTWALDARRFRQVLDNLLANAAKATPEGGTPPRVRVTQRGNSLVLVVRDFGPGLPGGNPDELFQPFVTHRTRGTGLGLAVVKRIVLQHRGVVTAENAPDGGAVFTAILPRGDVSTRLD